jgi:hypothetical protein
MRANLWRKLLLFKTKTQPTNNSNGHRGLKRHNTEVDGQMHSGEAKIVDLVGEHLQIKEITKMRGGR